MEKVILSKAAYYNIVRSAVEVYSKETTGRLFGKNEDGIMTILNACPLQTAINSHDFADEGNMRAMKRLDDVEKAFQKPGSNFNGSTRLVGGYHSHSGKGYLLEASKGDIKYALDELKMRKELDSWIEIIVQLRHRVYERPAETGERIRSYPLVLHSCLRLREYEGYVLSVGAFEMNRSGSCKQIPIRRMNSIRHLKGNNTN